MLHDCVKRQRNVKNLLEATSSLTSLVEVGHAGDLETSAKQVQQQFEELQQRIRLTSVQLRVILGLYRKISSQGLL